MSTDEEYLDNLLKTMSTDDTEENDDNKIMSLMNETDPMENKTAPMRKEVFSDIRPEDEIPSADKKGDEKKPVVGMYFSLCCRGLCARRSGIDAC